MSGKPLPAPGILQQKKLLRCISASLLAEWLKATEQAPQQVMQSLLPNQRYRGVDASAKGDKKADSIDSTIDELWRDMRWAVARIQGKPRCIVSQI